MAFASRARFEWQLRTRSLALGERTLIMAIVNVTPDSFSGDGKVKHVDALAAAFRAVSGGADIVDLGAESTRPGATPLSAAEEQARLLPVLEALVRERPQAVVSVDTYHAGTARAAVAAGAEIVNDVSGLLWDTQMAATVAELRCGLVLMHTRGRPQEWREQPALDAEDVVSTVMGGLQRQLEVATAAGIGNQRIVLDPGFGFGKLGIENFALLAGFARFSEMRLPLLAGISRKGFLAEAVAHTGAESRLNATTAANVAAILAGAHILRVHDLQAAREAAAIADQLVKRIEASGQGTFAALSPTVFKL